MLTASHSSKFIPCAIWPLTAATVLLGKPMATRAPSYKKIIFRTRSCCTYCTLLWALQPEWHINNQERLAALLSRAGPLIHPPPPPPPPSHTHTHTHTLSPLYLSKSIIQCLVGLMMTEMKKKVISICLCKQKLFKLVCSPQPFSRWTQ